MTARWRRIVAPGYRANAPSLPARRPGLRRITGSAPRGSPRAWGSELRSSYGLRDCESGDETKASSVTLIPARASHPEVAPQPEAPA